MGKSGTPSEGTGSLLLAGDCPCCMHAVVLTPCFSCTAASVNSSSNNATIAQGTGSLALPEIAPAPVSQDLLPPLTAQDILNGTLVFIIQLSGGGGNVTADQVSCGKQSSCMCVHMRGCSGAAPLQLCNFDKALLWRHPRSWMPPLQGFVRG